MTDFIRAHTEFEQLIKKVLVVNGFEILNNCDVMKYEAFDYRASLGNDVCATAESIGSESELSPQIQADNKLLT